MTVRQKLLNLPLFPDGIRFALLIQRTVSILLAKISVPAAAKVYNKRC